MSDSNGPVLIYGESGSERIGLHMPFMPKPAQRGNLRRSQLRRNSRRLIESELSDTSRIVLRAAPTRKEIPKAHGGTLFLDEVGDMSLKTQSKVLRTLEEQRFTPVVARKRLQLTFAVIASHEQRSRRRDFPGNFREDLFYRLNVIPFLFHHCASARKTSRCWTRHFLKELASQYGRRRGRSPTTLLML